MAIINLTTQYVSASFQNLAQVSSSGEFFNGLGAQVNNLKASTMTLTTLNTSIISASSIKADEISGSVAVATNATYASYLGGLSSSSFASTSSLNSLSTIVAAVVVKTGSYATTGSNTFTGTISTTYLTVGTTIVADNAITLTDVGTTNNLGGSVSTEFHTYSGGSAATVVIPVDFTLSPDTVFAKYVIISDDGSGANMRVGTVMATSNTIFGGVDVTISDVSATDIGDTSGLVFTCTDNTLGIDLDFSAGYGDWKIYLEITRIRM
jgi:hypothetical protein